MAGVKISALPALPSAMATDLYATVQNGVTYKGTLTQLQTLFNTLFLPLSGGTMTGAINMGSNGITSLANPVNAQDAATKSYVDSIATGGGAPVACATTANLNVTQSGAGVGATLTNAGSQAAFSVDGVTPSVGARVLVKNQSTNTQNGVYILTNAGSGSTNWVLTRATDYDTPAEINGTGIIPVSAGTVNADTGWINTTLMVTVDTTAITYVQFGISYPVTVAQGGTGLTSATAYALIAGGTTSTGNFQSLTTGSSHNILLSGGNAALPLWSTSTYPATNAVNTLLYASSANVMAALATANSSVLITSSGGVPSWSTTFPSGLTLPDPIIQYSTGQVIYDNNGNNLLSFTVTSAAVNCVNIDNAATNTSPSISASGSDTNITLNLHGQGTGGVAVEGTQTNDNAPSGYVGQFVSSVIGAAGAISILNNTPTNLTSISLGAGDWESWGNITYFPSGANLLDVLAWVSTTSATTPDGSLYTEISAGTGFGNAGLNTPILRFSLSTTTTIYITGLAGFNTGTATMCGAIYARRVR